MKQSAGILVFKRTGSVVEVLLAHPGGTFWGKKDCWSIPKGELEDGEDYLTAARREFKEELGQSPPNSDYSDYIDLGSIKQDSSKVNYIWAVEGDFDTAKFNCQSMVEIEWPPKSGQKLTFAENDKCNWFDLPSAKQKLFKAQIEFIDRLAAELGIKTEEGSTREPPQQSLL